VHFTFGRWEHVNLSEEARINISSIDSDGALAVGSHSMNKRQKLSQYEKCNISEELENEKEEKEAVNLGTNTISKAVTVLSTNPKIESRREVILSVPKPYSDRMQKSLIGNHFFFPSANGDEWLCAINNV
jgi:hypothetical protein